MKILLAPDSQPSAENTGGVNQMDRDLFNITPEQAALKFRDLVRDAMAADKSTLTEAWRKCATLYPGLYKKVGDNPQPAGLPLPNALGGRQAPRAGKPLILPALGLPPNATDDEYDVAWTANGGQSTRRNSEAILTALVGHLMQKHKLSVPIAKDLASARYPELWKVAGDKPVAPRI